MRGCHGGGDDEDGGGGGSSGIVGGRDLVKEGKLQKSQSAGQLWRALYLHPGGRIQRKMPSSTGTRYGRKITIQDLGADSSEQYVPQVVV